MKKIVFALMLIASTSLMAQTNVQLHYDLSSSRNYLTTTIERFKPDAKGSTFFFVDMNYNGNGPTEAYFEIARELKFWNGPFSAHVEYNGGLHKDAGLDFQINNAYLVGGTYSWNAADYSKGFSLSAMYKNIQNHYNNKPNNLQLTGVWYMNMMKGKVSFTGFADFWTEEHVVFGDNGPATSKVVFLTEPQLWYNFNKTISAGGEVEVGYDFGAAQGLNIFPTLAVKVNL